MLSRCLLLLSFAVGCRELAAQKWALQYFFDEAARQFRITDLAFPSAARGIAVGAIVSEAGKKPAFTALVTSDGGTHWALVPLKEFPRSIFFLNDSEGWMVGSDGIWFTQESGRSWLRLSDQPKPNRKLDAAPAGGLITRVWFLDNRHGFAVGYQKSVFETMDGGKTWTAVAEAAKPAANPAFSVYTAISFAGAKRGIIVGGYVPPLRGAGSELPEWIAPSRIVPRRTVPLLAFELDTRDGGTNWASSSAPVFGTITDVRLAGTWGLAVLSYEEAFAWPSEIQRIDTKTGRSDSVFKRKDRNVTGMLLFPDGRAYLAAVEPAGMLRSVPIPGKVKILSIQDLAQAKKVADIPSEKDPDGWSEMPVDYRAVATSVLLAGPDPEHLWAATDTGMILRWTAGAEQK